VTKKKLKFLFSLCALTLIILQARADNLFSYAIKQGFMQGGILLKAKDVDEVLKQENLNPQTKRFLILSKEILRFAENDLKMNTAKNYRKFIQLGRPWVTQIVVAAHKDRLESYLFSYPIVGNLPYKGFFEEADAIELQEKLKADNLDTHRRPVEAFSTTGWLPDPILSSMLSSESRFTELLFHELTHSTFYFNSQADFNEAFASWLGFRGALQFVEKNGHLYSDPAKVLQKLKDDHFFQLRLAKTIREILAYARNFYKQKEALSKREELFSWIKSHFAKEHGFEYYAKIDWNNALLLGLGTYYELVEPIEAFAQKNRLSPSDFLQKVKTQGPSIIEEILSGK
jgi:predicted aminopeptidase